MGEFLSLNAWHFLLVVARMVTVFMNLPGIGESYVAPMIRLMMGVGTSLVILPLVSPMLPPLPTQPLEMFLLIFNEILIGLVIGFSIRIIMSATHVAGQIASMVSGLGIASMLDPSQGQQGAIVGAMLGLMATVLIFVTDMHHMILRGVRDSYVTFQPGEIPLFGDLLQAHTMLISDAFLLGFQISAPFMVVAVILYAAMGVLSRLMPQLQVFFIVQPIQIFISLLVFAATLPAMLTWFLQYFENIMSQFLIS